MGVCAPGVGWGRGCVPPAQGRQGGGVCPWHGVGEELCLPSTGEEVSAPQWGGGVFLRTEKGGSSSRMEQRGGSCTYFVYTHVSRFWVWMQIGSLSAFPSARALLVPVISGSCLTPAVSESLGRSSSVSSLSLCLSVLRSACASYARWTWCYCSLAVTRLGFVSCRVSAPREQHTQQLLQSSVLLFRLSFLSNSFLFILGHERGRACGGGVQRQREGENPKQPPCPAGARPRARSYDPEITA